jgi:hypothetical protein
MSKASRAHPLPTPQEFRDRAEICERMAEAAPDAPSSKNMRYVAAHCRSRAAEDEGPRSADGRRREEIESEGSLADIP